MKKLLLTVWLLAALTLSSHAQKVSALPNVTTLTSNSLFSVASGGTATRSIAFGQLTQQLAAAWSPVWGSVNLSVSTNGFDAASSRWIWRTPVIAFDTWAAFQSALHLSPRSNIVERWITNLANVLYTNGLAEKLGTAIWIDDGWCFPTSARDGNGDFVANTNIFPAGFSNVIAMVHAKKSKVFLYTAMGTNTCLGMAGSPTNTMYRDIQWMMRMGADGVYIDTCDNTVVDDVEFLRVNIRTCRQAIEDYQALVYSTQGVPRPFYVEVTTGNGSATPGVQTLDAATFEAVNASGYNWTYQGVDDVFKIIDNGREAIQYFGPYTKPGFFPDMMRVYDTQAGAATITPRWESVFAVHAMACAQLRTGAGDTAVGQWTNGVYSGSGYGEGYEWSQMTNIFVRYLGNSDLMAVWRDPQVLPATIVRNSGLKQVWAKPLVNDRKAVLLINLSATNFTETINVRDFGGESNKTYYLLNVFTNKSRVTFQNTVNATCTSSNVLLFIAGPQPEADNLANRETIYSFQTVSLSGTGASKATTASQLPTPFFSNDGVNQTAANNTFWFNLQVPWWATNATIRLRMYSAGTGTIAWTNSITCYEYDINTRRQHDSTTTPGDGWPTVTNQPVILTGGQAAWVTNFFPMVSTNDARELVVNVNASSNASARYILGGIHVKWGGSEY